MDNKALYDYYVRLKGFKSDYINLYTVLLQYHNDELGYAMPTQDQLSKRIAWSKDKINVGLKALKQYGLVTVERRGFGNSYVVHKPISTEDEFYKLYPNAEPPYPVVLTDWVYVKAVHEGDWEPFETMNRLANEKAIEDYYRAKFAKEDEVRNG